MKRKLHKASKSAGAAVSVMLTLLHPAAAQNILMKDGTVVAAKNLRRQGDNIIATVVLPGGDGKTGELGYPLAKVERLDFPEPPQLKASQDLIASGKSAEALAQLEPVISFYAGFRDAPGSWWAPAVLRKVQALASLGRDQEAGSLAEQFARTATDPETTRSANVQVAANLCRKGQHTRASGLIQPALMESRDPTTRAAAFIIQGECLLARKEWEDAVLAFLQVPVFYPSERVLLPQVLLGRGRAHFGMDDLPAARAALDELQKTYPESVEAKAATLELDKITRREKALAEPK